jgi:hypothetical protein
MSNQIRFQKKKKETSQNVSVTSSSHFLNLMLHSLPVRHDRMYVNQTQDTLSSFMLGNNVTEKLRINQ